MKTILYNADTNERISGVFKNGYLVDDQPQPVDPPIFELEYKPTPMPTHDSETEVVSAVWIPDTILKTYTQVWSVRALTDEERIANRGKKDKDGKTVKPAKIQREFSPADKTVEKQLVAIFEKHKPKEEYTLIDTSITIENGKARGIINCRINGEHRQIRIAE